VLKRKRILWVCAVLLIVLSPFSSKAQLSFCSGDTGDAIFFEDFGTGTTNGPELPAGFTTYTFVDQAPQDGFYTISNNLSQLTSWHNTEDNTPNDTNGKAFIVNASFTADEFFRSTISGLCENTFYEFSAALINLYDSDFTFCANGGIPVNVRFEIWNETDTVLLASGDTGDINGTPEPIWNNFGLVFETTTGQETVLLKMINNGDGGCGNDLAIDDIAFRACGDTTNITTSDNEQGVLICESQTPAGVSLVSIIDFEINDSYEIQWQSSTNLVDWFDILGATSATYEIVSLTETTYYRVNFATDAGNLGSPFCSFLSEPFLVEVASVPDPPLSNGDRQACSNDPFPTLSVTVQQGQSVNWYDAPSGGNLLASNTTNYTPESAGTYYAQAFVNGIECESASRTAVTLSIFPSVSFNNPQEELVLCEGTAVTLSASINNVNYSWSTGETSSSIVVNQPGIYTVTATSGSGCSDQKTFTVNTIVIPEIIPIESNIGKTITIQTTNTGDFEYSLNGIQYQESPSFRNLPGGLITAFARNVQGCIPSSTTFYNVRVPTYFTPNGDGINDVFTIPDLQFFSSIQLQMFDRFGKLLYTDAGPSMRWDGTYNGTILPVNDYWYTLTLDDIQLTGHVSLLLQ
jgi:gliding motility-associated-like protein